MAYKIFVDGQEGTTGLQIRDRLANHPGDIEILTIEVDKRRDLAERKRLINEADVVFICLPDDGAKETVSLIETDNTRTKVIDASTAHRTLSDWAYGLPEWQQDQRAKIKASSRVAVPGCHASAFIMAMAPLVAAGIIDKNLPVTFHSITGYSGGGKGMIAKYEDTENPYVYSPRPYALGLTHKHIPEMTMYSGLANKPLFVPIVSSYYKGLAVGIPLHVSQLAKGTTKESITQLLKDYYAGEGFISVLETDAKEALYDGGFNVEARNNTNQCEIVVYGNEDQIIIYSRLDNLGKGASGAAVQCMNIMLGFDEAAGLLTK